MEAGCWSPPGGRPAHSARRSPATAMKFKLPAMTPSSAGKLEQAQKLEMRRATIAEERARSRLAAEERQVEERVRERHTDATIKDWLREQESTKRLRQKEIARRVAKDREFVQRSRLLVQTINAGELPVGLELPDLELFHASSIPGKMRWDAALPNTTCRRVPPAAHLSLLPVSP